MIEAEHRELSIRSQCQLLAVNRASFYYKPRVPSDAMSLANEIHEIWMGLPFYGYRRIGEELRRRGHAINEKRTLRLMREMGLQALYPRPRTTVRCREHKVFPYLLKDFSMSRPGQVGATDITYIKMPQGFGYLVAIIDVYSRYIVAWRLSNTLDTHFCLEMLEEALSQGTPEILNTDQGCQFTSTSWIERVQEAGIKVSMDGQGRWADNVIIERFWRTLKHEHVLLHSFDSLRQARQSIGAYRELDNHRRLHMSLAYRTPAEVHGGLEPVAKSAKPQFAQPVDMWKTLRVYTHPHKAQPQQKEKTLTCLNPEMV